MWPKGGWLDKYMWNISVQQQTELLSYVIRAISAGRVG